MIQNHYVIITKKETTTQEILHDGNKGYQHGWNPDGLDFRFSITDKNLNISHSTVFINTDDNTNFNVCFVDWIHRSSTAEQDIQLKIGKLLSRFGDVSK
jgi:hypothetical protein